MKCCNISDIAECVVTIWVNRNGATILKKRVNDTRNFFWWFNPNLLYGATPKEIDWLLIIKNITNTNRLKQRKTTSITLVATIFVIMSLIVLRAPLSSSDSTTLELPSILGSIFQLHVQNWILGLPPKCKIYLLTKIPSSSQRILKFSHIKDA